MNKFYYAALIIFTLLTSTTTAQQFTEQSTTRFPAPALNEYTNQISVGDVDNDGDIDLLFANGGNFFSQGAPQAQRLFINDGDGNFTDESVTRLNFFGLVRGAEMGDIDDDGDLDIILAQDFNRQPQLFANDGDGFFTNVTATQLPQITLGSSRAQFGDIDNDGDLDVYINSGGTSRFGSGQNRIYTNDGTGNFSDATNALHPIGNLSEPMDVIFGDIDGDFDLDVRLGSTGNNNSRMLRNDGTGMMTFTPAPNDSNCYSYDFADIDGDGDMDLFGANAGAGNTDLLLENDGNGTYAVISNQVSPNPNVDDNDSKFLDYDNDGDMDLIVARLGTGGERLYNNDGNGNFTQTAGVFQILNDSSLDIVVADLNGDGRLDVVTAQGESGSFLNRIYINNGPVDTIPPRVVDTEVADTETDGPYVVRSLILDGMSSDRNFFDGGITLQYSVDGGAFESVPMRFSGGTVYRGEIPPQAPGAAVSYFVRAADMAGNSVDGAMQTVKVGGLLGDVNCDGSVDLLDVDPFVALLANNGFSPKADFDGDGNVTLLDVGPFVDLLAGN